MKKVTLLMTLALFYTVSSFGQKCDCESNFEWVKKTFEENDAGFQYILDIKGKNEYDFHNSLYLHKVKSTHNLTDCEKLLYQWLTFFRADHLGINPIEKTGTLKVNNAVPKIIKENDKWETLNIDIPEFEQYLSTKNNVDYEGIWSVEPYEIGIKKVGNNYIGFIIKSSVESWKTGQVKLRINIENGKIKAIGYLKDKTPQESSIAKLIGRTYLQVGGFLLKRISPLYSSEADVTQYIQLMTAPKPYLEILNETTVILRIPSFKTSAKKDIDSIILTNKDKILHTKNLIIDIRNNGGGFDGSYKEIVPLIYTNPIRTVGVAYLSTKLNNQRMQDFIHKPEPGIDEDMKKWAQESYDTLEKHLGQFVNLESNTIGIDTLKQVYTYPKNVAILINSENGSTAEQFLLEAKQSKKVKLFGTTTGGVLDISNMYHIPSPCNEFELEYSLSKSYRIPDMSIDGKGIQPDYYIDSTIPDYKWIAFANDILNME